MREIKFRAWDKTNKKMLSASVGEYIIIIDGSTGAWEGKTKDELNQFEIMQYTGLKDKNGKEIYEGDILKDKWRNVGEVGFTDARFYWDQGINWGEIEVENDELEVIGNIYEHGELLNE